MSGFKKILFIINPKAGKAQSRAPLFDAACALCDADYLLHIHTTTSKGDASGVAARLGPLFDLVLCCGGDGTLNETIAGLMQLEDRPPLVYLPRGTTNDFAASLGLSSDPLKIVQTVCEGRERHLDIGRWNGRCFVYVASFGAFTRASYSVSQPAKNAMGHFAYILEGMKDIGSLHPYPISVEADGEHFEGDFLFGAVCNSTSIGGLMKLDPDHVVLDDGRFELLLVPNPKNAIELQSVLMALLSQKYEQGLIFRHVSHVTLDTEAEMPWSLDGEYAPSAAHVEIENEQGILTILT